MTQAAQAHHNYSPVFAYACLSEAAQHAEYYYPFN